MSHLKRVSGLDHKQTQQVVSDLITGSRSFLGQFLLSRLALDSHLQQELKAVLYQAVENLSWVHFANFLRDHGEEIVSQLTAPPRAAIPAAQPEGAPSCLCGHGKRPSHPFCYRCFQRLPAALKYDLADRDAGKRLPALASADALLRSIIARESKTRRLFGD